MGGWTLYGWLERRDFGDEMIKFRCTRRSVLQSGAAATAWAMVSSADGIAQKLAPAVHTDSRTKIWRPVEQVVQSVVSRDGAGVKLRRILGNRDLRMWDPFLLLDEMRSDDPADFAAGFPTHPHRGFETVTLMLDGAVAHQDSVGNSGLIEGGGVQWMTAGRGILHSEMPRLLQPGGSLWGYQLWVNLPGRMKMQRPRYQELSASAFAWSAWEDGDVRVIAGGLGKRRGPIDGIATQPLVLDVKLPAGACVREDLNAEQALCLYVLAGSLRLEGSARPVDAGELAIFGAGDSLFVEATADARFFVMAGKALREPVARRGPFVMNTEAELQQAFRDYRSGRLVGG